MIRINKELVVILLLVIHLNSWSQLRPLSELELDEEIGQAFITMDTFKNPDLRLNFTRINFGLDVKVQLNADSLVLGKYPREGELQDSDIHLDNFALGHIEGGEIIPFEIKDPFIELAFDNSFGKNDLAGIRLGFGDVKGKMSFDIKSLTGNINAKIKGDYDVETFLGTFTVDALAKATLVNESGGRDPVRATMIGVPNGSLFGAVAFGIIPIVLPVNNCTVAIVNENVCFPLSNFKTLDLGKKTGEDTFDFAPGMFLSLQLKDMLWGNNTRKDPYVMASKGAFFNIPNGLLTLTPGQALGGLSRVQTEFIDRGVGRF